VLCKHEVVGSIPSGSTSLRWLRQLRLGKPDRSEGCLVEAPKRVYALGSEDGPTRSPKFIVRENIASHVASFTGCACGISDIVKRRSIRVWDR
jgi:hypothetical protein